MIKWDFLFDHWKRLLARERFVVEDAVEASGYTECSRIRSLNSHQVKHVYKRGFESQSLKNYGTSNFALGGYFLFYSAASYQQPTKSTNFEQISNWTPYT